MTTFAEFLAEVPDGSGAVLAAYRDLALATGDDVDERVHRTEVAWAVRRVFTSAHVKSGRVQVAVDLLRTAEHPLLRDAFATTRKVVTHRLDLHTLADLDDALEALLQEAHDTVGPGTR